MPFDGYKPSYQPGSHWNAKGGQTATTRFPRMAAALPRSATRITMAAAIGMSVSCITPALADRFADLPDGTFLRIGQDQTVYIKSGEFARPIVVEHKEPKPNVEMSGSEDVQVILKPTGTHR